MRRPMPRLLELLISLQVPETSREAFLGDLEEEYARRQASGPTGGTGWLWSQALGSIPHWAAYRLARSEGLWAVLAVGAGLATTGLLFAALNTELVLEWMRGLPAVGRYPAARGLNLLAVATGGLITGRVTQTQSWWVPACLAGLATGPAVIRLLGSEVGYGPVVLWGTALASATLLGYVGGRTVTLGLFGDAHPGPARPSP